MSETDDDVPVPEQLVEERLTLLARLDAIESRLAALEEMAEACADMLAEWEALKAGMREIKAEDEKD
jgi:hypothetical protein